MANDAELWQKRFERERLARKSAEKLLEEKSLEIWRINQNLERKIIDRTAELEEALNIAKDANRAKDAFLSSMSHELRTPLNAIIGFSQILLARPDTQEVSKGFVEKIMIAGKSLLSLVNTILDFSKIEAGKMDFNPQLFEIATLIEEVQSITEPLLMKKRLNCRIERENTEVVFADRQLLKQVLINLISNAGKFSPQNGTISVSFVQEGESLRIGIADEGEGFPPDKIDTL